MGKESGKTTSLFRDMQFPLSSELVGSGEACRRIGVLAYRRLGSKTAFRPVGIQIWTVRNHPVQQTFILDSSSVADVRWKAAWSIAIS
jgi:hypothetical protein